MTGSSVIKKRNIQPVGNVTITLVPDPDLRYHGIEHISQKNTIGKSWGTHLDIKRWQVNGRTNLTHAYSPTGTQLEQEVPILLTMSPMSLI